VGIDDLTQALVACIAQLDSDARIDTINQVRIALHEVSPLRAEPVDCVIWVPATNVTANDYNPNRVAPPEMRLLRRSIEADGYTQPVVAWERDDDGDVKYEVVDGFHRHRVGLEAPEVKERLCGRLPVAVIRADRVDRGDRMAATIRHNRARGKHMVDGMTAIVRDLARRNWSDKKIGKELGMEPDEVLRLKQIAGLVELFRDRDFSEAWE
jgi:ParB-like chromosome segregation protein Spo0J